MIRIFGVNIPKEKNIYIALTYIYGIGVSISKEILNKVRIPHNIKCKNLNEEQIKNINKLIDERYKVEGNLRTQVINNIKHLVDIKCYKGLRHIKKLPVRGQRTHTNARTRKGKSVAIKGKKLAK